MTNSVFGGAQLRISNSRNDSSPGCRTADFWMRKAALAIGRPDLAEGSDDDLVEAHDAHMVAMMDACVGSEDESEDFTAGNA